MDAYLDIETTGLSATYSVLTVVGMYVDDGLGGQVIQPIGDDYRPGTFSMYWKGSTPSTPTTGAGLTCLSYARPWELTWSACSTTAT